MTKISIVNDGHQVHVDHDGVDLVYAIEKVQALFDATKPPPLPPGPASAGFVMEREDRPRWDYAALGVEQLPIRGREADGG